MESLRPDGKRASNAECPDPRRNSRICRLHADRLASQPEFEPSGTFTPKRNHLSNPRNRLSDRRNEGANRRNGPKTQEMMGTDSGNEPNYGGIAPPTSAIGSKTKEMNPLTREITAQTEAMRPSRQETPLFGPSPGENQTVGSSLKPC